MKFEAGYTSNHQLIAFISGNAVMIMVNHLLTSWHDKHATVYTWHSLN